LGPHQTRVPLTQMVTQSSKPTRRSRASRSNLLLGTLTLYERVQGRIAGAVV
jgi:hypothetical protein